MAPETNRPDGGQSSEDRYRLLFQLTTDGVAFHEIVCDASSRPVDYRFLDLNPAFERLTGLQRDQVVGRTVLEILPGTEPEWIERYGQVALTGQSIQFDQYFTPLGRHYEVFAFCPAPRQFAVAFRDVTERKRIEAALRRSDETYSSLFTILTTGVVLTDDAGQIVDANPAAERILGLTKSETLTRAYDAPAWSIIRPDATPMPPAEYPSVRAMREGRVVENVEMGVVRPDGGVAWMLTSARPISVTGLGLTPTRSAP